MKIIDKAAEEIRQGRFVIVTDDRSRENEGDLIIAAETITPEAVAFMVRHTSGIICTPMLEDHLSRLELPQMVPDNTESHETAFTVSVDYRYNTETGVSAEDRTKTIRALADEASKADDFRRPGHIFPLQYRKGGVLARAGHTEAALDLMRLAKRKPVAALSEIVCDDGTMMRGERLEAFAREHNLHMLSVEDLVLYRHQNERTVTCTSSREVETEQGTLQYHEYASTLDSSSATCIVHGDPRDGVQLVRVQLECSADYMLDDLIGERPACDCKQNLRKALQAIRRAKSGVLIILQGIRTTPCSMDAELDERADDGAPKWREIGMGSQILSDLGVGEMTLISRTEKRYPALEGFGLRIVDSIALSDITLDD